MNPLRPLTPVERTELETRCRSRTLPRREVERAQIILLRAEGQKPGQIARLVGCNPDCVTLWVKRFHEAGLDGLKEPSGRGRKPVYTEAQRGQMIAVARTDPQQLGQSFGYWSLRRLAEYLSQTHGMRISKSHLERILEAEGLRWYQEKTYFTDHPDPDFAEKRGR